MRIDAHHHVWDLAVRPQPWTDELPPLRRSFGLDDLRPSLQRNGIDGTVLVQTVTVAQETPEFLALADGAPEILGVVGWVDLTARDVAGRLAALRAAPGGARLVGIRHQVQGEADPNWLLGDDVLDGLRAVAEAGLVYDLLVTRHQLEAAIEVTARVPRLRFVLDHAGKPGIATRELEPWREQLGRLAQRPNVAVKLSGLATEAASDWSVEDLRPYADHVLDSFGPARVMAGSDWPVCLLRGSYDDVVVATDRLLEHCDDAGRADVLGGVAQRWYGLVAR